MVHAVTSLAVLACMAHHALAKSHGSQFEIGTSAMEGISPAFESSAVERRQADFPDFGDGGVDPNPQTEFSQEVGAASEDFEVGSGAEKGNPASEPACLTSINKFRAKLGVPKLVYAQRPQQCVAGQAQNDYDAGWHQAFGDCGEWAQTECKGPAGDVDGCIQAYIDAGSSDRHYKILASPLYKAVTCGTFISGSEAFYTQDFFTSSNGGTATTTKTTTPTTTKTSTSTARPTTTKTTARPTTTRKPTQTTTQTNTGTGIGTTPLNNKEGISSQECLDLINNFRSQQGRAALSYNREKEPCVNNEAQNDNAMGYHNSFGRCGESGQCECNGYSSIEQCINAYISEGPGGGHYEILRDARYSSVACGIYDKGNGRYFFTHSFFR